MSKAYELISESLNEIIHDLAENDGKNLSREVVTLENDNEHKKKVVDSRYKFSLEDKYTEQVVNY